MAERREMFEMSDWKYRNVVKSKKSFMGCTAEGVKEK